jgi:hypothetical protein
MSNPQVVLTIDDISILDKQIDFLTEFKPIPEHEVKLLCDKVSSQNLDVKRECRQRKSSFLSPMFNPSAAQSLSAVISTASSTT